MKESMSMTTIFQIAILFILLFTAIMCLTINNSNAFGVKDEIVNIIEYSEGNFLQDCDAGYNMCLNDTIVDAIKENQYRVTGHCDDGYIGYDKAGKVVSSGVAASVCIQEVNTTEAMEDYLNSIPDLDDVSNGDYIKGSYYKVMVFYQLDVPIINSVYNMQTKGETRIIFNNNR